MEKKQHFISLNWIHVRGVVGHSHIMTIGKTRCVRFSVCTSNVVRERSGATSLENQWFQVVAFEGHHLSDADKISKGSVVEVRGRVRSFVYTGESGEERTSWEIFASKVDILGDVSSFEAED